MSSLLALDSSTETLVVALSLESGLHAHESEGGGRASEQMVPQAMALLAQAGLELAQLDAIAFAAGPGAFTGLRTACAVAQGLAFGAARPVIPVDSLLLVAEDLRLQQGPAGLPGICWVLMDARMNEVYAAAYCWQGDRWDTLRAPALYGLPALIEALRDLPPQAAAGNALTVFAQELAPVLPAGLVQASQARSRAAALGSLARQAFLAGTAIDAAEAVPVYVRDKVAQTTAERQAAKGVA
ncbi:tRNA (adenosine(37)-N6)-threonylcarbamoyltransferase complex dimerization subunit type 1 TsaB [Mitsuaria sp. WAJ17]|uniref:tRNA (adenosine(37)-N6)-threonylcarbamoyltransferase complex dimerization subunit type 1 TsaB n=1 Tax=Mitsuaria sp. WAJ17 TaxID=2761452 RepID=UPI0015FECDC2|nr:tRNA (adenosine(37)-N6)-threonylcarbamoyltransferase complex dimerization subunit type 1 TsaB [Mitsuaria sp. WAJ17]MBB2486667.1 tRNA (adenosine(37)-N6)-threonylcarbamoyltransferase complex dimerization subunit type 1 TsaB [Mitsuaria sp. WAJ17]